MNNEFKKIIYIGGYGRSGSTLLDIALSAHDEVVGTGEIVNFIASVGTQKQVGIDNEFWQLIFNSTEEGLRGQGHNCNVASVRWVENIFSCLYQRLSGTRRLNYNLLNRQVFNSVARYSGSAYIVDSSKTAWLSAWRPLRLKQAGMDVCLVHVVRDLRAVIWSFLRGDNLKLGANAADVSFRFPVLRAFLGWVAANTVASIQGRWLVNSYIKIRYEDLVDNFGAELEKIGQLTDLKFSEIGGKITKGSALMPGNQYGGNRLKSNKEIRIKKDDEWISGLPLRANILYGVCGRLFMKWLY